MHGRATIRQITPLPAFAEVYALYGPSTPTADDASFERILFAGILSDGRVEYLVSTSDGAINTTDSIANFSGFVLDGLPPDWKERAREAFY